MGISLIEANAENSTAIGDATASLISRGVEAIWISPDHVASHGTELIVSKARGAHIPVFSSVPAGGVSGALFELGADYLAIGRVEGNLAADVLDGKDPQRIPVENVLPVTLKVNKSALKGLRENWRISDEMLARAAVVIDETGIHRKATAAAGPVR